VNDLLSIEQFRKSFIYSVSGALIFVANCFNRTTQLHLNSILNYGMNRRDRLFVVINLTSAAGTDYDAYNTYDKAISDLYVAYNSNRRVFDTNQSLNTIFAEELCIEYHQTDRIRFYFTVHDSSDWGKSHNAMVVKHIRDSLKGRLDIVTFDLRKEFLDFCNGRLGRYLVEWDADTMELDYHEKSRSFRPFWSNPKRLMRYKNNNGFTMKQFNMFVDSQMLRVRISI